MRFLRRWLLRLLVLAVLGVLAGAGGLYALYEHYGRDIPDHTRLANYEPPVTTRVHAADGRLVAEFAAERRVFVPIREIPRRVIDAFLAAEDKKFYEHPGIDIWGILRAVLTNVENMKSDRRPVGASTITQQVAKNFLLTNEVSMARKVKEAVLAFRIEKALTKDQILELYLNEIFLGNRSYGVAAAALNYFAKGLEDLTIGEAAYLAALPKAPNNYHPERQKEAALARRNWVIGRMAEDGRITAEEAARAAAEPLTLGHRPPAETVTAEFFAEEVRRDLIRQFGEKSLLEGGLSVRTSLDPDLQAIATRAMRQGLIAYDRRHGYRGPVGRLASLENWAKQLQAVPVPKGVEGWRLAVVLEARANDAADIGFADGARGRLPLSELRWARLLRDDRLGPEIRRPSDAVKVGDVVLVESLRRGNGEAKAPDAKPDPKAPVPAADHYGLRQIPEVQGGLVALDPHTGRVLAMVGGFTPGVSGFNRATQAMRQPGSAFKPFVYLTALDNGLTPSSLVLDAPFEYNPGGGQPIWRPENYSQQFYGPTPLRVGIEKSRNVMTVRLAQHIGMDKVKATVEKFGIVDNLQPYLPMALGAGETTVLRLSTAYAMLVNGGKRIRATLIDRVQDRTGRTIFRHDERPCQGCRDVDWAREAEAPEVPDTREQIADPRTCYQIVHIMEGVVQRGTATRLLSLNRPLAGKTGTTNDSNDAWFVGFTPDLVVGLYVGFDQPRSLGGKETGGSTAVPIFQAVMAEALKGKPVVPFRVPRGLRQVRVNPETGRPSGPDDRKSIWEAFIPGTEPGDDQQVLGGNVGEGATGGELSPDSMGAIDGFGEVSIPVPAPAGPGAGPVQPGGGATRPARPPGGAAAGGGGLY